MDSGFPSFLLESPNNLFPSNPDWSFDDDILDSYNPEIQLPDFCPETYNIWESMNFYNNDQFNDLFDTQNYDKIDSNFEPPVLITEIKQECPSPQNYDFSMMPQPSRDQFVTVAEDPVKTEDTMCFDVEGYYLNSYYNKKTYHNVRERQRRREIASYMDDLKNSIPSLACKKATRMTILKEATSTISSLKKTRLQQRKEIKMLKLQFKELSESILEQIESIPREDLE